MKRKGFSLVELMVVVAIITILSAIALPMYSYFRQKSQAMNAIGAAADVRDTLNSWYSTNDSFQGLAFAQGTWGMLEAASAQTGGQVALGNGLPEIVNLTWNLNVSSSIGTDDTVVIGFTWAQGCQMCDGQWCLLCNSTLGACNVEVEITDPDGTILTSLNRGQGTACP
ncbi:hypothetical protein SCOR_29475 [Sulfidibacter corallicola]